jgi:hypothetical protein
MSPTLNTSALADLAIRIVAAMSQPEIIARATRTIELTRSLGLYSDWDSCAEKVLDFGCLIEAAASLLRPGGSIETGVYRGGTSGPLILCAAAESFHVSIDPFGLPSQSYQALKEEYGAWPEVRRVLARLARLAEERSVTYCHYLMAAADFTHADLLQQPGHFRIVHLDGAHTKEAVVDELAYLRRKLGGPALFILDDHDTHFPGVGEAVGSSAGMGLVPVLHRYYAFAETMQPCGFSAWLHASRPDARSPI